MKSTKIKITVDAMGGDYAPLNVVKGAHLSLLETNHRFDIVLCGDERIILDELKKNRIDPSLFKISHAPESIDMHDAPTAVLKTKKNSSIAVGITQQKEMFSDAFVSAGNTGAVLAASTLILGRVKGISRPTLGVFLPSEKGPVFIIDAGANVDSRPQHLFEFGLMGSIFVGAFLNQSNPTIGLLSVGEEKSKGNTVIIEAHDIFSKSDLNFIGNIEGNDIFGGKANVVICDGFTGNIILKFGESIIPLLKFKFYEYAKKGFFNKIWMGLISKTIKKILKDFDYQKLGGFPLLGINGVVIIGHGKSSPEAIKNMILRAEELVEKKLNRIIEDKITKVQSNNQT